MSTVAAVAWYRSTGVRIHVFTVVDSVVTEKLCDGQWRPGPLYAPGDTVAATAWVDSFDTLRMRVFVGKNGVVTEYRWDSSYWYRVPTTRAGVAIAATSFVDAQGVPHVRLYALSGHNVVTEYCWDGNADSNISTLPSTIALTSSLAATSMLEGETWRIWLYTSGSDGLKEQAFIEGWNTVTSPDARIPLAATCFDDRGPVHTRVFVCDANGAIIDLRSKGGAWMGEELVAYGTDAAACAWVDNGRHRHIRLYVRNVSGEVKEYCWSGTAWEPGNYPGADPVPAPAWSVRDGVLRQNASKSGYQIRGVCYSRALIGEGEGVDHLTEGRAETWIADLTSMREMGANTIKIYGLDPANDHRMFLDAAWNGGRDPIFVLLSIWIPPLLLGLRNAGTEHTAGETMTAQVAYWRADSGKQDFAGELRLLREQYRTLVQRYAAHPAVMGFSIGAEVNDTAPTTPPAPPAWKSLAHDPVFWDDFMTIAAGVREELAGAAKIITTGLIDGTADTFIFRKSASNERKSLYPPIANPLTVPAAPECGYDLERSIPAALRLALNAQATHVAAGGMRLIDVWGIDVYKFHGDFKSLIEVNYEAAFTAFGYSLAPLLIAEFGEPASEQGTRPLCAGPDSGSVAVVERTQSGMIALLKQLRETWRHIEEHTPRTGSATEHRVVCGGCVFQWADEWWKPEGTPRATQEGSCVTMHYKGENDTVIYRDEKWFGLNALVDDSQKGKTLRRRRTYYALRQLWKGVPMPPE